MFRRIPLHERLAREGGLLGPRREDHRMPWDKAGIHGVNRPREWDEVSTLAADVPGEKAQFVALDEEEILVEEGADEVAALADALALEPPYRAEAVRRSEGVWAVAARRIEIVRLPEVEGDELELSVVGDERSLVVDGFPRFGSIPQLERAGDYAIRAGRLEGDRWEVEVSPL